MPAILVAAALLFAPVRAQLGTPLPARGMAPATGISGQDSAKAVTATADTVQVRVIKKDLNAREQILIGTSIMVFIVVVMSFMNNFNPD